MTSMTRQVAWNLLFASVLFSSMALVRIASAQAPALDDSQSIVAAFESQARDASWAPTVESQITNDTPATSNEGYSIVISSVECRTSLCRIRATVYSGDGSRIDGLAAFHAFKRGHRLLDREAHIVFDDTREGVVELDVIATRPGHTLAEAVEAASQPAE